MIPIVNICNIHDIIRITDTTQDSQEYIPEDVIDTLVYNQNCKFKYSETCTINVIQYNAIGNDEIVDTIYTTHETYLDEAYYKSLKDGHYTIHHFILPTVEWLQKEIEKDNNIIQDDIEIYVTDGEKIYNYRQETIQEIPEYVLKEITPDVLIEVNDMNTTISKLVVDTVNIYYLEKCYIQICKNILNVVDFKCYRDSSQEDIFNRDLIWMTINIIKYHIGFHDLVEAQRLIELINKCGGICQSISTINRTNSCGCCR